MLEMFLNAEGDLKMAGMSILFGLLIVLAWIDIKTGKVPLILLLPGSAAGFICFLTAGTFSWKSLMGGLAIGGVILLVAVVTRESIGIGDGLVFIMTGLFLGAGRNLALLVLASGLAAAVSVLLMLFGKITKKQRIPFVPFILLADAVLMWMTAGSRI